MTNKDNTWIISSKDENLLKVFVNCKFKFIVKAEEENDNKWTTFDKKDHHIIERVTRWKHLELHLVVAELKSSCHSWLVWVTGLTNVLRRRGWEGGEYCLTRTITYIIIVPSSHHNLCCSYVTFIFLLFTSFLQVHCQYPPLCFSDPGVTSHRWSRYIRLSDWICTHLNWKFFVLEILRENSSLPVRVYFFKTTQLLRNSWAITKGFRCQTFF